MSQDGNYWTILPLHYIISSFPYSFFILLCKCTKYITDRL
ncbi:hypothetical protein HMPREF0105_2005 [Bacteroides sp. 3_1_33FAA]|uniref:Uncharacterized protein n=1 Tax=Phocaeicola dorei DSM 17855 TaxID=483217 RepID=B6VXC6_9BACT|nr:hypothetical protein BACDOR_01935 [Phocaeicola dorei DSM 17855]EEZ21451.1 hypothetical protein HMPREF0105_2005 [Bacteroides sp. 3_1_33FAA]